MKQVNFSHEGGFPLEQETLERLQTAYRSELYEAFKSHLGLKTDTNYLIAHATDKSKGWAVIHQNEEEATGATKLQGILYPINNSPVDEYLRTTRTRTNLIFGAGTSQTAYYDYDAKYINQSEYNNKTIENPEDEKVRIYDFYSLRDFSTVPDIDTLSKTYLPLDGSKAMQGDLDLGNYRLSRLDTKENYDASVRASDFNFGSANRRGVKDPGDYLGRALVDNSDQNRTDLTLNYDSDWENTTIGGKVHLNDLNTNTTYFTTFACSTNFLLIIDDAKKITKSSNLLNSLLSRITKLETEKSSAIPLGMIAIWGKTAPFPDGWEEYIPLRGRMPIGFDEYQNEFNPIGKEGGAKNKTLTIPEMPPHFHHKKDSVFKSFAAGSGDFGNNSSSGRGSDGGDNSELAIGNLKENYNTNGDALEQTVGNGLAFSILNPYRVVHFIEYTGKPSDKTAPTTPTNLTLLNATSTTAYFSWTASTDNVGVDKYLIYKNGQPTPIGEVYGYELSYTAYNLDVETQYTFTVAAKDVAGNILPQSQPLNITTANVSTIIPANLFVELQNNEVYLNWDIPVDPGIISYEIWRRIPGGISSPIGTSPRTRPYYYDYEAVNVTYLYKIRSKHVSGNYSGFTEEVIITKGNTSCFDIESPVTMASGQ